MRLTIDDIPGSPQIHLDILRAICDVKGTEHALDVMCCEGNSTRNLNFKKRVMVDLQYRKVEKKPGDIFVVCDVFDFLEHDANLYDVAFCLDGIEHLSKTEGFTLLELLPKSADKVIFFTPLGKYMVGDDQDPDHHHSGWYPEDFEAFGYSTIVFSNFHEPLGVGAFFAFKCTSYFSVDNTKLSQELERVFREIKNFSWTKRL